MTTIGILALQGDILEHERALRLAGVSSIIHVKTVDDLKGIDGIILPGGESTVMGRLAAFGSTAGSSPSTIQEQLAKDISNGLPTLATCAGVVLLARNVKDQVLGDTGQQTLECIDITVTRNIFGRQQESFEAPVTLENMSESSVPFPGVFIRAPSIESFGNGSIVLGRLDEKVVALQQKKTIMTVFHPELTNDLRFFEKFLSLVS